MRHFSIDKTALIRDLEVALTELPIQSVKAPNLSPTIEHAIERGWIYATLMFYAPCIRIGHLVVAMLKTPSLSDYILRLSNQLIKIDVEVLTRRFRTIVVGSPEDMAAVQDGTMIAVHPGTNPRDIFICYRRTDSRHLSGRIFDRLTIEFGPNRVFKDVDSIPLGVKDFAVEIQSQIRAARLMLILIGPTWLTVRDENGQRRIDDQNDFVHIEVKWGIDNNTPMIPLLFDDATMPPQKSLSAALQALAGCQSFQIREDPNFHVDMDRLINSCRQLIAARG